jgi:hypothetical protein
MARKRWVAAMMAVSIVRLTISSISSPLRLKLTDLSLHVAPEHGEERRAGRADAAQQHHGVDGAGDDGDHARLRHQRLHRRHVPVLLVRGGAAACVREQGRDGVRGQVPGRVALLHARLRVQRAGHPAVRARQLPTRRPAARRRGQGRGGVRGVRGAHREPGQPRLVAGPARLLRLAGALPLDVRAHPDAGLQRAHVRPALPARHHQRARPRAWPRRGTARARSGRR